MTAPPTLSSRSRSTAALTVLQLILSNGMRLCSNLVLARLLQPEAFGFIGLAMTVITAVTLLSDIGIARSIIREPDGDTDHFLRAAWRVKVLRGGLISGCVLIAALLLWIAGPALAPQGSAYAEPILPGLIALTALLALMAGCESTCFDLSARRMDLRRVVLVQLVVQAVTIATMLLSALVTPSAWAIMTGMVAGSALNLLLTHLVYPGPRMGWTKDPDIDRRLWTFGRWIILSSTLAFLQFNADKLILAALLGPAAFGHYAIALIWVDAAAQLFQNLRGRIAFPAFSEIALNRRTDLPRVYRRLQRLADVYLLLAFLLLHFGATVLIGLLYPAIYADAAHFITLACLSLIAMRFSVLTDVLISLGDSRAQATASAIQTTGLLVALPIGWLLGGIDGLIIANTLQLLTASPFLMWKLRHHLPDLDQREDVAALLVILLAAVALLA